MRKVSTVKDLRSNFGTLLDDVKKFQDSLPKDTADSHMSTVRQIAAQLVAKPVTDFTEFVRLQDSIENLSVLMTQLPMPKKRVTTDLGFAVRAARLQIDLLSNNLRDLLKPEE